ncbi:MULTISPECIES: DUF3995 domain-containing protein [Paenibacillus]|uniref:DUF3995 domain-containing protein n=1 Tax=Paenibacillus TaxID=44249 RepID=UPI0022B89A5B|nr:DUF3995 domain-containing protein [Paenibacillus caseinilyticus]MCZ8518261.1 DUF3995 domain-containing protein [Paenibacillus caseinilyticus]
MSEVLAGAVSGVLFLLSGVHLYWLFGGRMGHGAVIPSTEQGPLFRPRPLSVAVVAALLAFAAWLALELGGSIRLLYSDPLLTWGGWLLSVVFILRGLGDWKWVGVFKRKKGTPFAKWDSMVYSPLCLLLGGALFALMRMR